MEHITVEQVKRAKGRLKTTWMEVTRKDMDIRSLNEDIFLIGKSGEESSL